MIYEVKEWDFLDRLHRPLGIGPEHVCFRSSSFYIEIMELNTADSY